MRYIIFEQAFDPPPAPEIPIDRTPKVLMAEAMLRLGRAGHSIPLGNSPFGLTGRGKNYIF